MHCGQAHTVTNTHVFCILYVRVLVRIRPKAGFVVLLRSFDRDRLQKGLYSLANRRQGLNNVVQQSRRERFPDIGFELGSDPVEGHEDRRNLSRSGLILSASQSYR